MLRVGGGLPPEEDFGYMSLRALAPTTFTFTIPSGLSTGDCTSISYSIDYGETWVTTSNVANQQVVITTPVVAKGEYVLWKGTASRISTSANVYSNISSDAAFTAAGNVLSLLHGDNYATATSISAWNALNGLLMNSKVKSAENLRFPATSMQPGAYISFFNNCTLLEMPPKVFPKNAQSAFQNLFYGCSNLKVSPEFPDTTVYQNTFNGAFRGCTSLEIGPTLPALTLVNSCYGQMFYNCSKLKYIKMMATDISAGWCLNNWVTGVASSGTFVMNSAAEWTTTGNSGIPTGWTVVKVDS